MPFKNYENDKSLRYKKMVIVAHRPNKGLDVLTELFDTGKVVPVIDRRFPLGEVAEALRYFGEGHHKGKIIITMESYIEDIYDTPIIDQQRRVRKRT